MLNLKELLVRAMDDSASDVQIDGSATDSRIASSGVRRLWPRTSEASNTSRNKRSASGATRSASPRGRSTIKSTSLWGATSRRP